MATRASIEQVGLGEQVDIEVRRGHLVVRPVRRARSGWDEAFGRMGSRGDDALIDPVVATNWDRRGWKW